MTTLEKELISKSYYQTFLDGNANEHPLKVLGEMFMDERESETSDLSDIRFAQGEVYFLNKDFEAAIFKWENVSNELKPWALKNIGDAHYELDLLAIAEDYYNTVETESGVLKAEVLLQLFSLYIRLDKLDLAVETIKNAVDLNPDYPDVTTLARAFFEDHQDWDNAVELAVNEAIRTESLSWFEVVEGYAVKGHTVKIEPNYFRDALMNLYHINQARFESLTAALWQSYRQSDMFFPWLKEMNDLLMNIDWESPIVWKELSALYKETYFELINGKYVIREISHLIPNYLTHWLKISKAQDALVSSSAVISWNEIFPSVIGDAVVAEAETVLRKSPRNQVALEDAVKLFESIINWTKAEGLSLDERFEWLVHELLDLNHYHLLIAGSASRGQLTFINRLVNEDVLEGLNSTAASVENGAKMQATTDEDEENIPAFRNYRLQAKSRQALIPCRIPVSFMHENELSLDTPLNINQGKFSDHVIQHLHLADSLLFVLNVDLHLSGKELEMAIRMRDKAPELPIHFLLWKTDQIANSQISMELVEKTVSRIEEYFPDAKVTAFSTYDDGESQLNELSAFARSIMDDDVLEEKRTSKVLYNIKMSIKYLLEKRVEMENSIMAKIEWNEELTTKLKGAHTQLSDMEEQRAQTTRASYGKILDKLDQDLMTKIPEILRSCSEMVKEDSDFRKIHIELNEEMNKRITTFIEETALPEFKVAIQGWIQECEQEFRDSQAYLDDMSESFNHLYGEEKVALNCDFKVLDDWRRDVDRMTRGRIQLEKANILLRTTPSQLLFKSAGMVFALSKSKELLHNKYKQFIETKDYSQTAELITDKFIQPFELFEQSLERDVSMFFTSPVEVLNRILEELHNDIEEKKVALSNMRKNPEIYRDPLTLFEVKLRQYEWMSPIDRQTIEFY